MRDAASVHRAVIETGFPLGEVLDACIELAEIEERGFATSIDRATLVAHLRTLRADLDLTEQEATP